MPDAMSEAKEKTSDKSAEKISRRQQILQALARELEASPGERITTAGLARAVGVSEAALYRHFPSKAKMFEGLIEFIEESVFGLINRIMSEETDVYSRLEKTMGLLLGFAEKNAGMTRLLSGDVLTGETERLRARINKFYERVESQLKQILREGEMKGDFKPSIAIATQANLLLAFIEGKYAQYVKSGFSNKPLASWPDQWALLQHSLKQQP